MARIRSVHPEIAENETLVDVSPRAERTFLRLLTYLDDDGRGKDNLRLIKAGIYPLHDDMTIEEIDVDLWELVGHGLLLRYEVDGQKVIAARANEWRWQKPQRPTASKLPAPPEDYIPPSPPAPDVSDNGSSASPPRVLRESSANTTRRRGKGEGVGEGGERDTRGPSESLALVPATPDDAPSARVRPLRPATSALATNGYPSDFEAWYQTYPRHRAKADAFQAWKRARGLASWEELWDGLQQALDTWRRERTPPDKIPYPATWLNGRRWEDEPAADVQLAPDRAQVKGIDTLQEVLAARAERRRSS